MIEDTNHEQSTDVAEPQVGDAETGKVTRIKTDVPQGTPVNAGAAVTIRCRGGEPGDTVQIRIDNGRGKVSLHDVKIGEAGVGEARWIVPPRLGDQVTISADGADDVRLLLNT